MQVSASLSVHFHLLLPAFHSLAPSLHGRVVINPYFIAENSSLTARLTAPHVLRHGEDQTQSSLPPSRHLCLHLALITEIVEGWRGGWGRRWRKGSHHYTLGEGTSNGRMHNMLTRRTEEEEENEGTKKTQLQFCRLTVTHAAKQQSVRAAEYETKGLI